MKATTEEPLGRLVNDVVRDFGELGRGLGQIARGEAKKVSKYAAIRAGLAVFAGLLSLFAIADLVRAVSFVWAGANGATRMAQALGTSGLVMLVIAGVCGIVALKLHPRLHRHNVPMHRHVQRTPHVTG